MEKNKIQYRTLFAKIWLVLFSLSLFGALTFGTYHYLGLKSLLIIFGVVLSSMLTAWSFATLAQNY